MGLLVDCGVRTVLRPVMMKERTEYDDVGSSSGVAVSGGKVAVSLGDASSKGGLTTSVDEVSLLKETNADYVFYVRHMRGGPHVVLVKRDDSQVLHSGQLEVSGRNSSGCCLADPTGGRTTSPRDVMRKLLVSAGIVPGTSR